MSLCAYGETQMSNGGERAPWTIAPPLPCSPLNSSAFHQSRFLSPPDPPRLDRLILSLPLPSWVFFVFVFFFGTFYFFFNPPLRSKFVLVTLCFHLSIMHDACRWVIEFRPDMEWHRGYVYVSETQPKTEEEINSKRRRVRLENRIFTSSTPRSLSSGARCTLFREVAGFRVEFAFPHFVSFRFPA